MNKNYHLYQYLIVFSFSFAISLQEAYDESTTYEKYFNIIDSIDSKENPLPNFSQKKYNAQIGFGLGSALVVLLTSAGVISPEIALDAKKLIA